MFQKTRWQKNDTRREFVYFRWFSTKNKTPSELQKKVLIHIGKLVDGVDLDLKIIGEDFERLANAVEYTIYERLLEVLVKVKAFERLVKKSGINADWKVELQEGTENTIRRITTNLLTRVGDNGCRLSNKYTQSIDEIISDNKPLHWTKIGKYMQIPKPDNYLEQLYDKLFHAPEFLRDELCSACGWSRETFFARKKNRVYLKKRRILTHPFTEAESEKIIKVVREMIVPVILDICSSWEKDLQIRTQKEPYNTNHLL